MILESLSRLQREIVSGSGIWKDKKKCLQKREKESFIHFESFYCTTEYEQFNKLDRNYIAMEYATEQVGKLLFNKSS